MSRPIHLAVVGATGAVGAEVLRILEQRRFPIASLRPIASPRSEGRRVTFAGEEIPVHVISEKAFEGVEMALFDTPDEVALEWVPKARDRGVVCVDNSAALRLRPDVPLIVPEVNADAARGHKGIIANPNCTMVTLLMPLAPLHRAAGCRRVVASSYQSTSGAGVAGVADLYEQLGKLIDEREAVRTGQVDNLIPLPGKAFAHPIAFNVIPHVGGFDDAGTTSEERRVRSETLKILDADFDLFATCVRVPTVIGHGISAWVEFAEPLSPDQAREILSSAPGVTLEDDPGAKRYPTPLQAAGGDKAIVGRIRAGSGGSLGFFSCADNLRKGAALNTVQIGEMLIEQGLL